MRLERMQRNQNQHAKQEPASQIWSSVMCVVFSFTDSETSQWNSEVGSAYFFYVSFLFITLGVKFKPASFTAWREKLGKQEGKTELCL